jgi:hypothetical protein
MRLRKSKLEQLDEIAKTMELERLESGDPSPQAEPTTSIPLARFKLLGPVQALRIVTKVLCSLEITSVSHRTAPAPSRAELI